MDAPCDARADADAQVNHDVSPDSMIILRAAQDVVSRPGFDEMLDETRDRVDEIEGESYLARGVSQSRWSNEEAYRLSLVLASVRRTRLRREREGGARRIGHVCAYSFWLRHWPGAVDDTTLAHARTLNFAFRASTWTRVADSVSVNSGKNSASSSRTLLLPFCVLLLRFFVLANAL